MLNEIKIRSNNRCALRFAETTTKRGFGKLLFSDYFNKKCSLQISSVGTDECVWLGVESAEPCLLSADAIKLGLAKKEEVPHTPLGEPCGWVEYPVPKEVMMTTRMHLTREQAKQLALKLLEFALCGRIK